VHEFGPVAVRPFVDEFFRKCADIVISQDGIVDHFLGDATLAFFNAPVRHEDHVARAVAAATQIQLATTAIRVTVGDEPVLKVGIGVTTGLAFTGTVGSASCSAYTALGDTVNIAARLQGHAAPGEILASEHVYQAVKGAFPSARKRVLELKGIPQPVKAYALT
jgi:adenylate cyclase